jgi:membrane protease subunit (stomatin/prohibitin family)
MPRRRIHGKHPDSVVAAAADENLTSKGYIEVLTAMGRMRIGFTPEARSNHFKRQEIKGVQIGTIQVLTLESVRFSSPS